MDVKSILQNPERAIERHWGSTDACTARNEIFRLASHLRDLKSTAKQVKEEKGQLSRRFKEAKNDPDRFEALKEEMSRISSRLAHLQDEARSEEKQLLEHFHSRTPSHPDFPERFRQHFPQRFPCDRLTISTVSESQAEEWDDYVKSHQSASLYHLYAWKRVIERAFGHACYYYAARNGDGHIVGTLPVVAIKSRLFGHYAVSLPFFNYGGGLAEKASVLQSLMDRAGMEAQRNGWEHVEYRTCQGNLSLPCSDRKVSMILALPQSGTPLDGQLRAKVRAQINQAHRHSPRITFGGSDLLDDFYQVFSRNMRDLGTPVYGKDFFEAIVEELANRCTLVRVTIDRKPVAVAFLAGYKDMLEIPWASTLKDYNGTNVNMWMYRQILAYAIDDNYRFFDFGRSTIDAGTYQFKKQWGAKPVQHYWYYHLEQYRNSAPRLEDQSQWTATPAMAREEAQLPGLNPENPRYRLAIETWKRLPLLLANVLGPHIVKNLP